MKYDSFGKVIKELVEIADCRVKDLAFELSYDDSYVSKWINNRKLPSTKAGLDIIDQMSDFFASMIRTEEQERRLLSIAEREIPIDTYLNKKRFITSLLEDGFYRSAMDFSINPMIELEEPITDSYSDPEEIDRTVLLLLKKYISISNEKVTIYTNLDFYDEGNKVMADLSFLVTKEVAVELKWLRHKYSMELGSKDVYETYKLASRTLFINTEIYYNEEQDYPPFIYIEDKIALSFTTNCEGEVIFLTHTREPSVLQNYNKICKKLFNRLNIVEKSNDYIHHELDMITESLYGDNQLYIYDAFLQGYFLPEKCLIPILNRYSVMEREYDTLIKLSRAYQRMLEKTDVFMLIFQKALDRNAINRQIIFGKRILNLTEEEWEQMVEYISTSLEKRKNLKIGIIIDELFPLNLEFFESSMYIDSKNIWFKKNPIVTDQYIDTYVHVSDKSFSYNLYQRMENKLGNPYIRWMDPEEIKKEMSITKRITN